MTDDVATVDLGEVLPSVGWLQPENNMRGLIGLSNGIFAGFYDNTLYMSEPYYPEAWPTAYQRVFSEVIIGISHFGTNIVVCTDAGAYLVYGTHPSNMTKQRLPGFHPCVSMTGIVSTEFGVMYPSNMGILLVNQSGIKNLTENIISKNNMTGYHADYWVAGFHNNKYIAFYTLDADTRGGIIYDVKTQSFVTLTINAGAVYHSWYDGEFYIAGPYTASDSTEYIQMWEGDVYNYLMYTWRSKRFTMPRAVNYPAARVIVSTDFYAATLIAIEENEYLADLNVTLWASDLEGSVNSHEVNSQEVNGDTLWQLADIGLSNVITFKLYVDSVLRMTKLIDSDRAFRLPSGFRGRHWEFEIEGYIPISGVSIAPSVQEIMSYANS
jgi:hypothetical protein